MDNQVVNVAPAKKLNTKRGLLKFILLSIITFGIYPLVAMSGVSSDINIIASRYDGKKTIVGEGILEGKITTSPRGENGFGFDPIFELVNGKTLAELTSEEKNNQSARYLATIDLKEKLLAIN